MVGSSIGGTADRPALLVVGAASRDLTAHDRRGWRLGGGVTYGALTAARLGLPVRALIGVDSDASTAQELVLLKEAGIELELVALEQGPVMENRETPAGRVQLVSQASQQLPVAALPDDWREQAGVLLAPVADELADDWSSAFPGRTLVALAWQGLFRRLVAGRLMEHLPLRPRALVTRADVALVSADDAAAGGAPLVELLRRDGQQLVVSHGPRGVLHLALHAGRLHARRLPAISAEREVDSTGAGDVFLAAWVAAVLAARRAGRTADDWRALAVAAATAGLSVRASGLEELPDLADVCALLRRWPATPPSAPSPSGQRPPT
ncbi:MAG TPA: PfkB family carbohydrate kinase [Candidatus Limnocylindria bacterium]|nr:PfkB family carbohydrate kinase [Candidatus Limnocylindria bacterium]